MGGVVEQASTSAPQLRLQFPVQKRVVILAFNDQGRRIGETHHNARIPDATVDLIRELHEDHGYRFLDIADGLELSFSTVAKICNYARRADTPSRWKRKITDSESATRPTHSVEAFKIALEAKGKRPSPMDRKNEILELRRAGATNYSISKQLRIDPRRVADVCRKLSV